MKVLHVINSMIVGGAEILLKDTVINLHKNYPEIEQHLITVYEEGAFFNEVGKYAKTKNLKATKKTILLKALKLRKYIIENKIDVVHAHLYDAMILSRISTPKNVKLVQTYHNGMYNPELIYYSKRREWVDYFTYSKKQQTIFVSNAVRREIVMGVPMNDNTHVVYNFNSDKFYFNYHFKPELPLKLVSVGNLRLQKNHEYSIKALGKLKHLDITLDIYGYGDLEKPLRELIEKTGAKVSIINNQIVSSEILSKYDAFIMSSFLEGMSIALLESMTTGLPSILSDIPSFRETATDSAFYFDIKKENTLPELLTEIHNNKQALKILAEKAHKYSDNFSISKFLSKLTSIYYS